MILAICVALLWVLRRIQLSVRVTALGYRRGLWFLSILLLLVLVFIGVAVVEALLYDGVAWVERILRETVVALVAAQSRRRRIQIPVGFFVLVAGVSIASRNRRRSPPSHFVSSESLGELRESAESVDDNIIIR